MKKRLFILLTIILSILVPSIIYANSAEPPALIVIVTNVPSDFSIYISSGDSKQEGAVRKTAWETYYAFYKRDIEKNNEIVLTVTGNGISYNQVVGEEYITDYNNIITLDYSRQTISEGKLLSRTIILTALRISLTLIIEGLFFLIFRFHDKRSWIAFLIINLITQGLLNISLNTSTPFDSYLILELIIMEFLVLLVEIIAFLLFVKEHGKLRRIAYVLTANIASLILGGYLITVLPV